MGVSLYPHQIQAINELKSGSILCGGVGSGKSRTALSYFFIKECLGELKINNEGVDVPMKKPKPLYVITTALKRDTKDWEGEVLPYIFAGLDMTVDSWNNLKKYTHVKNAFFIFDEQRLVGYGAWVKSFLKIAQGNNWILLSATPGDTWMDYVPIFIANGFYKNKTDFQRRHVIYSRFSKFPKIERFIDTGILLRYRRQLLVHMPYARSTTRHPLIIPVKFDVKKFDVVKKKRWDPYKEEPIRDVAALCYVMRKVVNSDISRLEAIRKLINKHPRLIIFYNFNYELELLRELSKEFKFPTTEWNGHKHESVPNSKRWLYLVQYTAGAEGWNCTQTNAIVFFSLNYSYKIMEQAEGRIDRLNTKHKDLYYYTLKSSSIIDSAISRTLKNKKTFNEKAFGGSIL